jgi:Amt family ammonium transporter
MVGAFLTGIFASQSIAALDGVTEATGGIDGNGMQVGKQLAEVCAISVYSFTVSCILLYILKFIPGMQLRVHEEGEMVGLDQTQFIDEQIGERGILDDLCGSSPSPFPSPAGASVNEGGVVGLEKR